MAHTYDAFHAKACATERSVSGLGFTPTCKNLVFGNGVAEDD